MLIEALVGINVAVADESGLKDAFTQLSDGEKRSIYLETLSREELEQIERNTARLTRGASDGDPYWCLKDDELFAVMVDTCGPETVQNAPE